MSTSEKLTRLKDKFQFFKNKRDDRKSLVNVANGFERPSKFGEDILVRATKCRRTHLE